MEEGEESQYQNHMKCCFTGSGVTFDSEMMAMQCLWCLVTFLHKEHHQ